MKARIVISVLFLIAMAALAFAGDDGTGRWWREKSQGEYTEGACKVKIQTTDGEHVKEIKCKDGVGAGWNGEYTKEYEDADCKVKVEATRDEYKERVKCDR